MAAINAIAAPQPIGIVTMPATSSFLAAFEYDQQNLTLTTHMKNGAIYQQKFFLPMDWLALQTSQDHSKHWSKNVRGKKLSVKIKSAKAPKSSLKHKWGL
jgi:hypothetical protein